MVAVDRPITGRLKNRRIAASDSNEGFLESTAHARRGRRRAARVDLLWEPTQRLSLIFVASHENLRGSDARAVRISNPNDPRHRLQRARRQPGLPERGASDRPRVPGPAHRACGRPLHCAHDQPGYPGGSLGRWQTRSDLQGPRSTVANDYVTLLVESGRHVDLSLRSLTSWVASESQQSAPRTRRSSRSARARFSTPARPRHRSFISRASFAA